MQSEQFGPYRIEAVLARGPRGERLRAIGPEGGRAVALEVLSEALSADPGYRERFGRDTDLAARLAEPRVVPVHRTGEVEGRLFVERPLVPGRDLAAVLAEEGPLDPARAVAVVGHAAAALDAAHAAGLAHGELTAAEVLLTGTGAEETAVVTGLGVPRPATGPAAPGEDVFALAALLHEALTGRRPASEDVPPPSAVRPGLPPRLDAVVLTGLAADPAERYATSGELAAAARSALRGSGVQPAAATGPDRSGGRFRIVPVVLAGIAALAALALVLAVVLGGSAEDADSAEAPPTTAPPATTTASTPTDDAATVRLRSVVPGEFIDVDCDPGEPADDGSLAALGCGPSQNQPGAEDSVFYLYQDGAAAEAVFLADMERNGVPPLPEGASCPQTQGHTVYEVDGVPTGRMGCWIDEENNALIAWTQTGTGTEGLVTVIDGGQVGLAVLHEWWSDPENSFFAQR